MDRRELVMATNPKVGGRLMIWINQGSRQAEVLAVVGDLALVEYEMPNGTTALNILDALGNRRAVSYRALPLSWLRAVVDAESVWIGQPQQGSPAPTPTAMLAARQSNQRTC